MMKNAIERALVTTLVAVGVGCSSEPASPAGATAGASGASASSTTAGGAGGTAGGAGSAGSGNASDAGRLFGNVAVDLVPDDHTGFLAIFFDGPQPVMTPLDLNQERDGCRLLVPHVVSCDPPCAVGAVCTGVGTCTPRPSQVSVGVLHVQGLGGMNLDLEPTAPTVLSYQAVPTLPYPPCREGDDIGVQSDSFALAGKCISSLAVTSAAPIPVTSGQATHFSWTPPGRTGISTVQIALEISHHGGFKGEIDCDVADTGAFDMPEPLVTALVKLGRAGYPTVKLMRTSIATAPTQPDVKLVVSSQVELEVDTGIISCGNDASPPCPAGTVCQIDYTCR